jgi:hypothetical protein
MLMRGFASEIVDMIGVDGLQDYVHGVVEEVIPRLQAAAD